ncbi:MAG: hypothetical protein K2F73_05030 [Ruminococcus sp.]|nr:hypothetical protein [Ruminococcus sp.]
MKSKILFGLSFLWSGFVAFTLPVCMGWIYMDITGHSKGYDYNLGDEKSISILMGIVELIIWLLFAVPSNIYLFRKINRKINVFVVLTAFAGLFVLCVNLIGGWTEFGRCFNIGGMKY